MTRQRLAAFVLTVLATAASACAVVLGDFDDDGTGGAATSASHASASHGSTATTSTGGASASSTNAVASSSTVTVASSSASSASSTSGSPRSDGEGCGKDAECQSGNCVQGLCCAMSCSDMGADSCDTDGACSSDGSTCELYPSGTPCGGAATCSGGMLSGSETCDGSGLCVGSEPVPCPGHFACESSTGCATTCSGNGEECISAEYTCGMTASTLTECLLQACVPCSTGNECASSLCENGFCE